MKPWRRHAKRAARRANPAFTLLELLVVIGLIALLSSLVVPAIRALRSGKETASATRQLLDDLAYARLKAINERTTVYVVFIPPQYWSNGVLPSVLFNNLAAEQLTGYALYVARSVGDQPGAPHGRYLTPWKSLPDGVFIPPWKFTSAITPVTVINRGTFNIPSFETTRRVPFPTRNSPAPPGGPIDLPYVAFTSSGGLSSGQDEFIPLARGDIFPILPGTPLIPGTPLLDAIELPPGNSTNSPNLIRIDGLTGRARVERPELP
jgi:prepilin-type N-terminal cleavage/methylation domain-containing protein